MKEQLLKKIKEKEIIVGVVGLGYVGLPLAVAQGATRGAARAQPKRCP